MSISMSPAEVISNLSTQIQKPWEDGFFVPLTSIVIVWAPEERDVDQSCVLHCVVGE